MRIQVVIALAAALLAGALTQVAAGQAGSGGFGDGDYEEGHQLVLGTVIQRELEPDEGGRMRAAGLDSVRIALDWSQIEAQRGEFDWAKPDEAVRKIALAGLTPMPFLFATPAWAARIDGYQCPVGQCAGYAPASVETRNAFAEFAARAVQRYGPDGVFWRNNGLLAYRPITVWQVWNEPNLRTYWLPYVSPPAYAQLVRAAAEAIGEEDPNAEVVLAGLSGNRTTEKRLSTQVFLQQFYAVPGISSSFDGVAVHPYYPTTRGVLRQVRTAHRIVDQRDPGAGLWVTEVGWASRGDERWVLVKTLDGQARMLRRVFGHLLRNAKDWDLRGLFWYAWRDAKRGRSPCGWCAHAGLLDRYGEPKPAYEQLRRLANR